MKEKEQQANPLVKETREDESFTTTLTKLTQLRELLDMSSLQDEIPARQPVHLPQKPKRAPSRPRIRRVLKQKEEFSLTAIYTIENSKRITLPITFQERKIGFTLSSSTKSQIRITKTLRAKLPGEILELMKGLAPKTQYALLRNLTLALLLAKDIRATLHIDEKFSDAQWERIKQALDPPYLRIPRVGLVLGKVNNSPHWASILYSLFPTDQRARPEGYVTLISQYAPHYDPKVFFPHFVIPPIHHRLGEHRPCLGGHWSPDNSIFMKIGRTVAWITAFEIWERTGEWPAE